MKFACAFLVPAVASAQLLGFGASCPVIQVEVTNYNNPWLLNLLAVAHSPAFALFDEDDNDADDGILDLLNCPGGFSCPEGNGKEYGFLAGGSFGVSRSPYVCGGEDKGYHFVNDYYLDFNGDVSEESEYVDFGDSYDTFYLRPENTASCNCGDMRISIFAEMVLEDNGNILPDEFQSSALFLNSHELVSLTDPSSVRAPAIFAPCIPLNENNQNFDCILTYGSVVYEGAVGADHALIQFRPQPGSSTSFLSLWALLMGGWF